MTRNRGQPTGGLSGPEADADPGQRVWLCVVSLGYAAGNYVAGRGAGNKVRRPAETTCVLLRPVSLAW